MPETAYDAVPYPDVAYTQTHPSRLAAMARLHGLSAPDPATARVLEIGCGAGANLLGIAYSLPAARCLGIDVAAAPIGRAAGDARAAGVPNVSFEVADVCDAIDGGLGEFDYVIAHGVYAWVPPEVREALLGAAAAQLARDGLAYVSYNAQPGGNAARLLREAGLWHARDEADPLVRAEKARDLFRLLARARSAGTADAYAGVLERVLRDQVDESLETLHHDILNEHWEPVWFADFAAHAARHGLEYVCEAWGRRPRPEGVEEMLRALGGEDRIAREQYADILRMRRFRASVLTRAGRALRESPDLAAVHDLHFVYVPAKGEEPAAAVRWLDDNGPAAAPFEAVCAGVGGDPDVVARELLDAAGRGLVMPWLVPPRVASAGERPRVSALVRWQASQGRPLTTLVHKVVVMDDGPSRTLVGLLDGTRDRSAILADLRAATGLYLHPDALERNLESLARLPVIEG